MSAAGWVRLALIGGLCLLLELLCRMDVITATTMIPPSQMVMALGELFSSGTIAKHIVPTFKNVTIAFLLAVVGGFLLGATIHSFPRLRRMLDPLLASYYAVPFFALYPLFIVIFGMNDWPLIMIGLVFGCVAVIVSTLNGFDRVPPVLLKVTRVHRMSRPAQIALVILPSMTPQLITGIKLALAYAFIGILAGEFILSSAGVGYAIAFAYDSFNNRVMYGLIVFTLVLVTIMNLGLQEVERRLLKRWRR